MFRGGASAFRQPPNRRARAGRERRTTPVSTHRRPMRIGGVEVCASPVCRGAAARGGVGMHAHAPLSQRATCAAFLGGGGGVVGHHGAVGIVTHAR